jgi:hypothetical protein
VKNIAPKVGQTIFVKFNKQPIPWKRAVLSIGQLWSLKKLPKVNNRTRGEKFAQSGHPGNRLGRKEINRNKFFVLTG